MSATPTEIGARPGDILHVRSSTAGGWLVRRAFARQHCWGNHDALVVQDRAGGGWFVAEALLHRGFCLTPYARYAAEIAAGETSVAVLRCPAVDDDAAARINDAAFRIAGWEIPYDITAILGIWCKIALRVTVPWLNAQTRWYCTEGCARLYATQNIDPWAPNKTPTPWTTERRVWAGKLTVAGHAVSPKHPQFTLS